MCRRLMLNAALLLVFVGVLPKAIHGLPVGGGADGGWHGGVMNVKDEGTQAQCLDFTNHYCNQVQKSSKVYLPNPRGHTTLEQAIEEFNHFLPLLQQGCHPKLATLLCFFYFPFCADSYPALRVYPCKEVCDEVTGANSSCTAILTDHEIGWNNQLHCDQPHFSKTVSSNQCVDGVAPPYPGAPAKNDTDSEPSTESATTEDVTESKAPTESATTEDVTDGEAPTESEECGSDTCPTTCDYRGSASPKTFKINTYCYAAKVTVKSYKVQGCHHAYTVEVKNQFDLETPFNQTHSTKAPSMGDSAVILTSPSHCETCPKLEVSKTYFISGPYSRAADGSVQWRLGDSKSTALKADWSSKYDRKAASFVSGGNTERQLPTKISEFLEHKCEKDTQLVSAEQWIRNKSSN